METLAERFLFWAPRGLGIAFAVFLGVFALDVFGEGLGAWETALALLIHLVPTGLVVLALLAAWRQGWVLFGPLLFIGLLFRAEWAYRRRRTMLEPP
ncbi:MAG: hypothetical protein HKN04_01095 [Rhodothermaceae bacterium]|nr:hypothetical protein [Rhodothermaceae bacterium]